MSVTLKLLATHQGNKPGTIITVDDATGAQLLRGNATLDLTGGVPYVAPVVPNIRLPTLIEVTPTGDIVGLVGPDGKIIKLGATYVPAVSQYERALIFAAPPRQGGAVKGFSRNFNDAQYCMALGAAAANLVSDADIYDCEQGALTVGMSYNAGTPAASSAKALAFQWRKMLWDLGAGESLFVQARVKAVGATGNQTLFGNSNGTTEGFGVVLNLAGTLAFNFKAAGTAAQSLQIQGVQFDGTNVVNNTIASDTWFNVSIHVDGDTKKLDSWVNGIPAAGNQGGAGNGYGSGGSVLNAGSTIPTSPHNFGLGYIPADDSFTPTGVKAARFQAFRMAVMPAGKKVRSPAFLDWMFNNNPRVLFDDNAYYSE